MDEQEKVYKKDDASKFAPGLPCKVRNAGLGCNIWTDLISP